MSDPKVDASPKKKKVNLPIVKYALKHIILPRKWRMLGGLFFIIISRAAGLVLPGSTKYLIDEVIGKSDLNLLFWMIAAVAGAEIIKVISEVSLIYLLRIEAQHLIKVLREKIQQHIIYLQSRFFDNHTTGELTSRIMTDVEGVRNLVGTGLVGFFGSLITAGLAIFIVLQISWKLTLYTIAPLLIIGLVVWRMFVFLRPIFKERRELNAEVTGRLTESLGGIRIVKAFSAEKSEVSAFSNGVDRLFTNVKKTIIGVGAGEISISVMISIVGLTVMGVGGANVISGDISVGDFVAFSLYLIYVVGPLAQMAVISNDINDAFAGLDRMNEILQLDQEGSEPERTERINKVNGNIRFENVIFAYEKDKDVIKNLTFEAKEGSVTALVGPSGSGKSTIAGLVASFLKPDSGTVFIDDKDLSKIKLSDYRTSLGIVLQDDFLFEGTIRENILFSNPKASDAALLSAVNAAHVNQFTDEFEKGLETIVGERGVKLSGGQRQRVAIARAILANPRILILDEATSNLDSESEAYIQDSLEKLMEGRTSFVIAHRLSTIRKADQILFIEDGQLIEKGTHDELIAKNGRYAKLHYRQTRI